MNELDELVYALEDLDLSDQKIKVLANPGETGGPQGNFIGESSGSKREDIPREFRRNSQQRNRNFEKQFHNDSKAKFMPSRLTAGEAGSTQFLDLDCKREPGLILDQWAQNLFLFFLLGKGVSYTNEEKFTIAVNTFTGKVNNWYKGLSTDAKKIFQMNVVEAFEKSLQEGMRHLMQFIGYEFLGNEGNIFEHRDQYRDVAKELLEKLQICKMSYIQEYTCEFEEYYYNIFDSKTSMIPYMDKYFQKLPGFWASYFMKEYSKEDKENDSLGKRISFLNQRLSQLCMMHNMQRKAKRVNTQIHCYDTEAATQWGCKERKPYKRRKKNRYKGLIKRKNITKKNYIPRKRYYKKKNNFKKKSTSTCKCYNCGEEGHKSYECNKKRVKISRLDREEIDSDLESISSIRSEDFYEEIYEEYSETDSSSSSE